jgi:endonuclease-3
MANPSTKNKISKPRFQEFVRALERQHPENATELHFKDSFELLIATVLSAQCSDQRVNKVTPSLFRQFPNAFQLSGAKKSDVESLIRPTGLFRSKTRSLLGIAHELVRQHDGSVPATMSQLLELPGVGRKTANVVLSQALELPGFPVDRHVIRVVNRLGVVRSKDPVVIETELCAMLSPSCWARASSTLIAHGRRICKPRPICSQCSLRNKCPWMRESGESLA